MARDWLTDPIVTSSIQLQQPVSVDAKFLRRGGEKFLLKGMRLRGRAGAIDFNEKLILRKRLEELAAANVNTLILSEAQAESVLGVAGQAGLVGMVEIAIDADQLAAPKRARATIERVGKVVNLLCGDPALAGFLIDCRIDAGTISRSGIRAIRRSLEAIACEIRKRNDRLLVALKRQADAPEISITGEDFIYLDVGRIDEAGAGSTLRAMHDGGRPLVIEFGEDFPGGVEGVDRAFGGGAAGVVAPALRPAVSAGWQNVRMLSAGELLPFTHLGGSAVPLPAVTPLISVVVGSRDNEETLAACLESIGRLQYPNYEVIVIDAGTGERGGDVADAVVRLRAGEPVRRFLRVKLAGRGTAGKLRVEALRAARGELIAFTRGDCIVDEDWLTIAAQTIAEGGLDGCRGPVCAPRGARGFAARVAAALERSQVCAEGIGETQIDLWGARNLVMRKSSLAAAGGRAGRSKRGNGDDCDAAALKPAGGLKIGWCAAGVVTRCGRATIGEFLRDRIEAGRREAIARLEDERPVRAAADRGRFMEGRHFNSGVIAWAVAGGLAAMGGITRVAARRYYCTAAASLNGPGAASDPSFNASGAATACRARGLAIGTHHAHPAHPIGR